MMFDSFDLSLMNFFVLDFVPNRLEMLVNKIDSVNRKEMLDCRREMLENRMAMLILVVLLMVNNSDLLDYNEEIWLCKSNFDTKVNKMEMWENRSENSVDKDDSGIEDKNVVVMLMVTIFDDKVMLNGLVNIHLLPNESKVKMLPNDYVGSSMTIGEFEPNENVVEWWIIDYSKVLWIQSYFFR